MINKLLSIFALTLINAYKYLISPFLGNNCRFLPTCSEYMKDSIVKHGFISGVWMGLKRISKCHPWGKKGYDPVK
ncbi:membrane protein insertion efficiency factor YidD [Alphaproteobacteria bacterium]|jgi:putative membrane protein insertion efficiency factor|nr:membrane protein insertion efficiency factor YidD [Alphaproteobacteria bacterium]|tara:strand:- start:213 stop:437 length:225 start_codon:yes stop_codon:yes gene_type:complete